MGAAIDYALSFGLVSIRFRLYQLADKLRGKLKSIDGIKVTDEGLEKCGIVTFMTSRMPPSDVKRSLRKHRINVLTSNGSDNLVSFQHRGLTEVARASLYYYNTEMLINELGKLPSESMRGSTI